MITEQAVRALLNTIVDPCSEAAGCAAGLDEMGLVRAVTIGATGGPDDLTVVIGVTEFGCLMGAPFADQAWKLLSAMPGVGAVTVNLDSQFDWQVDDLDPRYQARLQAHRQQRIAHIVAFRPSINKPPEGHHD